MLPRKALLKSTAIYTISYSLPLAASIVLLPFYTNTISTANYGALALYIAFTLFMQMLMGFSFDMYVSVHYHKYKNDPEELKKMIGSIFISLIGIGAVVTLLFLLIGAPLFTLLFSHSHLEFLPYGLMSLITAFCNSFFKTYTSLLITREESNEFFWANGLNFVLTIAISIVGIYLFPGSIAGPMWGRLLSGIGILVLALYRITPQCSFRHFDKKMLQDSIKYCTPNVFFLLIFWAAANIDRYIIQGYLPMSDVGIYDFAIKTTMLIEFSSNGLISTLFVKVCAIWQENDTKTSTAKDNSYVHIATAVIMLIVAINIIIIPPAVWLMVRKEAYWEALKYVPILCIANLNRGLFNVYTWPLYFYKETKKMPWASLAPTIIQISLSWWFIKDWGLWGMVWIGIIAKIVHILCLRFYCQSVFTYTFNNFKMIVLPLLYAISVVLLFWIFPTGAWAYLGQLAIALLLIVVAFRNEIRTLLISNKIPLFNRS